MMNENSMLCFCVCAFVFCKVTCEENGRLRFPSVETFDVVKFTGIIVQDLEWQWSHFGDFGKGKKVSLIV